MKQVLLNAFAGRSSIIWTKYLGLMIGLMCTLQINAQDCTEIEDLVLACNGGINVALGADCEAEITLPMILNGTPWTNPSFPSLDEDDFELIVSVDGVVVPSTSNIVTILDDTHVGGAITAMVTITDCGMTCWGEINLEDKTGVVLENCFDYVVDCEEWEAGNSQDLYKPTFNPGCSMNMGELSFEDDTLQVLCVNGYSASIIRTWVALDDDGQFLATCEQTINVLNMDVDDVEFPEDYIYDYTQDDDCQVFTNEYLAPSRTGYPTGITCPNIKFYYNDVDFDLCGASRKILRNWTVIDWCSGDQVKHGQIIKVLDDEPPIKVCPPDTLKFPAMPGMCTAEINLDPWALEHGIGAVQGLVDCSEVNLYVEFLPAVPGTDQPAEDGEYSSVGITAELDGTYTLPMLPEGLAWIRYRFEDECGNASPLTNPDVGTDDSGSCYFEVQVIDTLPPTAICEGFTKVKLDASGHIEVFAETFDDHSFDICGEVVDFEVKRIDGATCTGHDDDDLYGESVHFCCADLGDTLVVMLKVIDDTGRYGECEAIVCVEEEITNYTINCPDDITLNCDVDYTAHTYDDVTFSSTGICGMGVPTITGIEFDDSDLDLCGIGDVVRTVTVSLPGGGVATCDQIIELVQVDPLAYDDITVQHTIVLDGCNSDASYLTPEIIGGFPEVNNSSVCVSLSMNYEDLLLTGGYNEVCQKIKRTWTVIDWCTYELGDGFTGLYTFEQIIKLDDGAAPTFISDCADITIDATYPECEATLDITILAEDDCTASNKIVYRWKIDVHNDGLNSNDINGNSNTISQLLPGGTHKVTFMAIDLCGNTSDACMFLVHIVGSNTPVPICLASVVWGLDEDGEAEVWASDFDLKSEGGCGDDDDLTFSFTNPDVAFTPNMFFDCDDIPNGVGASILLTVYVIDASGAYESCVVTLKLQDSQDACTDSASMGYIGGLIFTEDLEGIDDAQVDLYENMTDLMDMEMTIDEGKYTFDQVPFYNGYMVKPGKEDVAVNGVSTLDIVLIRKHILGLQLLDSPYKLIAADVNQSNSISAIDLLEIRKVILGVNDEWTSVDPWAFVPASYQFADEQEPWGYPEASFFNAFFIPEETTDFIGIKMGDVNNNAVVSLVNAPIETRSANPFIIGMNDVSFQIGETVDVELVAMTEDIIEGAQFTIEFDPSVLTYDGFTAGLFQINETNIGVQNVGSGYLTLSYDDINGTAIENGKNIFTLSFTANATASLTETVQISSFLTQAEVYTQQGEIQDVILQSSQKDIASSAFELLQNQPNPFDAVTEISFYLPSNSQATFEVMSVEGKVIHSETGDFHKGLNKIVLDASEFAFKGVLLYRLEVNGHSETKKMIYIK